MGFLSPESSTLFVITPIKLVLIILAIIIWTITFHIREKKRTGKGLFDDLW